MRGAELLFVMGVLSFSPTPLSWSIKPFVMVWNVGQGQMVSWVRSDSCAHFDMGGEFFPWEVASMCRGKPNLLYVTHADYDHINFVPRFQKKVADLCLARAPLLMNKPWQWRILSSLRPCPKDQLGLKPQTVRPHSDRYETRLGSLNTWSWVFIVPPSVLIAGDSPKTMERRWVRKISGPEGIRYLVAGHHGSQTSTSLELLRELTSLETVVISARKARYGHPHHQVLTRLLNKGARIILTEKDGSQLLAP